MTGSIRNLIAVLGLALAAGLAASQPVAASEIDADIEAALAEARARLDEAAAELAELHKSRYGKAHKADRAMLGVLIDEKGDASGLTISGVTPNGGAHKAGLKGGDRLLSIGGERLEGVNKPYPILSNFLDRATIGDVVRVEYARGNETHVADITTQGYQAHMEHEIEKYEKYAGRGKGGKMKMIHIESSPAHLMDVDADLGGYFGVDSGVLVLRVPEGVGTLKSGDILLELDGVDVVDARAARAYLAAADGDVRALVRRTGRKRSVDVAAHAFAQKRMVEYQGASMKMARLDDSCVGEDEEVEVRETIDGAPKK